MGFGLGLSFFLAHCFFFFYGIPYFFPAGFTVLTVSLSQDGIVEKSQYNLIGDYIFNYRERHGDFIGVDQAA